MTSPDISELGRRLSQITAMLQECHPTDDAVLKASIELAEVTAGLDAAAAWRAEQGTEFLEPPDLEQWRWQQLFDLAPVAYIVTDAAGLIVEANTKAISLLGLMPRIMQRMPLVLRFAPSARPLVQRMLREPQRYGQTPASVTLTGGDHTDFRGALRCVPVRADRVLWVLDDVSTAERARELLQHAVEQERAAAEQLRAADAMRRAFLLGVSHDLRVPLAAIAGFASLLHQATLDGADRERALVRLEETAYETVAMLDDLLDYERIDQPTAAVHRTENADISSAVEQAATAVPPEDHVIHLDTTPTSGNVDLVVIDRTVSNLVRNAVQHTPAATTIWVRCRREPDGVLLVVEDDGPGVAPESRDSIFELFQRTHQSPGVGAGLALVRRFARLHGGYARVEERPGGGASFQVLLDG